MTTELRIERATDGANAATLGRLCTRCFPWGMRWAPLSSLRARWWRAAIGEGAVCLIARDGRKPDPAGVCLVVLDEPAVQERLRAVRPTAVEKLLAAPHWPVARYHRWNVRRKSAGDAETPLGGTSERPRAWVEIIAVDPSRRGSGFGRRLLDESDRVAREAACRSIDAMTGAWNTPAQRMFGRFGYRLMSRDNGQVVLSKPLEGASP